MATVRLYYTNQIETSPTLNRHWELNAGSLFVVDNIAAYLATKSYKEVTLQFIKHELEIAITVDMNQLLSQPKNMNFRYVSIQNLNDTHIYYYFVKNVMWRSKSAVRLELVMDVLNTFTEGTDYNFKESTRITREHKDRFEVKQDENHIMLDMSGLNDDEPLYTDDRVLVYDYNTNDHLASGIVINSNYGAETLELELTFEDGLFDAQLPLNIRVKRDVEGEPPHQAFIAALIRIKHYFKVFRVIDYVEENINPILQNGSAVGNTITNPKSLLNQDWYLLYRNQNDPSPDDLTNPVDCFLIPKEAVNTDSGLIENGRLIPSFLEDNKWYVFKLGSGQTATLSNGTIWTGTSQDTYILITKNGNKLAISLIITDGGSATATVKANFDEIGYITFTSLPVYYHIYSTFPSVGLTFSLLRNEDYDEEFNNTSASQADSIEYLDRTDPKNIKLIKIPYCPYNFTVTGTTLNLGSDWELVSINQSGGGLMNVIRLKNLNYKLNVSFTTSYNPLENFFVDDLEDIDVSVNDTRYPLATLPDSKLFHSEFYKPTYVYDSFTYAVQLEKVDTSNYYDETSVSTFYIRFDMTSTINSKFMFTFTSIDFRNAESNFANVMPIARNNEEVLYNVAYISYIKTGYNYDLKNKNIANTSNYVGLALSAASIGASLLAPSVPLKVMGVVASMVSLANSIKSTVVSTMQNENSIKQKLNQAANQTASVQGSDDVDLMSVYAQNRLKYFVYKPTAIMQSLINDLFFYAGYRSGRMGLPNHNTRVNFDYLECDPTFENLGSIPNDCLEQLVNAFKTGVTYLHETSRTTKTKWDFRQEYENWEVSLLGD